MTDSRPRPRVSPLTVVLLIIEGILLVLFIPGLAYVEVLQHDGAGGPANALGFAITLAVIAIILVVASAIGFVRDRRSGIPIGLTVVSIVVAAALAIGHAAFMIPNAVT